jgi:hypothetical protein
MIHFKRILNIVSYKGEEPSLHAEDKCSSGFARVHCCMQDWDEGRLADYGQMTMTMFSIGSL